MASQTAATRLEDTPEALTTPGIGEPVVPLQVCGNVRVGIESGPANVATPLVLDLIRKYKGITGSVASAVLFAFYEQCFSNFPPGTSILRATIEHWRLGGLQNYEEHRFAFGQFGYRYPSLPQFEAARYAGLEWIHPVADRWLLYILVPNKATGIELLVRNGPMIDARLGPNTKLEPKPSCLSLRKAARMEAQRFMAWVEGLPRSR
jgi:hypothetical protein